MIKRLLPACAGFVLLSSVASAAPKTYQVTGTVEAVTDSTFTVLTVKGKEHWEIARDGSTKVTGELKTGARVTVEYRMSATRVDVKDAKK